MKGKKSIKKYAKIFVGDLTFEEASSNLEELTSFSKKMKSSQELFLFFKSPLFSKKERARLLAAMASDGKISQRIYLFTLFLSNDDALSLLDKIIKAVSELLEKKARKLKAQIISAEPLQETFITQLKHLLEDILHTEVIIETLIDPSLIAGFKVKAGSMVYDGTVRNQLTTLKKVLLKT